MEENELNIPVKETDIDRMIALFGEKLPESEKEQIRENLLAQRDKHRSLEELMQMQREPSKRRHR